MTPRLVICTGQHDVQTVEVEVVDSKGKRWKAKWVLTK